MLKVQESILFDVSRAVQVTVEFVLAAKVDPDSLSQVVDAISTSSSAVARGKVTAAPATLVAARVWSSGQEMLGSVMSARVGES
jgi:hypothetical protein